MAGNHGNNDGQQGARMKKLDEYSNTRRAELQSRHLDEMLSLERSMDRRMHGHEKADNEYYGPYASAIRDEMREINRRNSDPGLFGFLRRALTGADEKDRLERLQLSLDSIEERLQARRTGMHMEVFEEKEALKLKQEMDRSELENELLPPGCSTAICEIDNRQSADISSVNSSNNTSYRRR